MSHVKSIIVNTTVTPGGQFPDTLEVTFDCPLAELIRSSVIDSGNPDSTAISLDASHFSMSGQATNWMDPNLHDFEAGFVDATISENGEGSLLTLSLGDFKDKYFFVESWAVTNSTNEDLSFDSSQIEKVIAPVADDFKTYTTEDGEKFNYHLFTPEDDGKPLPIVVVFHGFADTHNLLAYRTSLAWATKEAQEKRPCYVLSPTVANEVYFMDETRASVFPLVYEKLQEMITDGKVDKDRIYVMGNSFGGMSTIEFSEMYPDVPAGAMALCAALNYSKSAMDNLEKITAIPLRIAAAENDGTIPAENSKNMYQKLSQAGSKDVSIKIYTDDEMNAAGGSSNPDSTFSYHHVEMAAMEGTEFEHYAEWLFSQHK